MTKFKITYKHSHEPETIEASGWRDIDERWVDFYVGSQHNSRQVLRVDGSAVQRIEVVAD